MLTSHPKLTPIFHNTLGHPGLKGTFYQTALGTVVANGIDALQQELLPVKGNNAGMETLEKMMAQTPWQAAFEMAVVAPLFEETVFRLAPNILLNATQLAYRKVTGNSPAKSLEFKDFIVGNGSPQWTAGIVSAGIFAAAHSLDTNDAGEFFFNTAFIPTPQFLLGLLFWHLTRTRGIHHAMFAHALINGTAALAMSLG